MIEGYEIDFLPITGGPGPEDAICLRYGVPGDYRVIVYDGGSGGEAGHVLQAHIRNYYDTDVIDHIICSQPDAQYGSGLTVLMEEMRVGRLWMHRPWAHSDLACQFVNGGTVADDALSDRHRRELTVLHALEELARERGIPVQEPFQGCAIGPFTVLSPNRFWYVRNLLAQRDHPDVRMPAAAVETHDPLWASVASAAVRAAAEVAEKWGIETLEENVATAPVNETSVVLFGILVDRGVLLTGDAGVQALAASLAYAEAAGISIRSHIRFAQVPHHGNRNNVSPSILDRLVGPAGTFAPARPRVRAYVSAPRQEDGGPHVSDAVVNALTRRGAKVVVTNGQPKCHHYNMEPRTGWGAVEQERAVYEVERVERIEMAESA